jgi:hypothetical protein
MTLPKSSVLAARHYLINRESLHSIPERKCRRPCAGGRSGSARLRLVLELLVAVWTGVVFLGHVFQGEDEFLVSLCGFNERRHRRPGKPGSRCAEVLKGFLEFGLQDGTHEITGFLLRESSDPGSLLDAARCQPGSDKPLAQQEDDRDRDTSQDRQSGKPAPEFLLFVKK